MNKKKPEPWHINAAKDIYKHLLAYFKAYGLGYEPRPPINDIAADIQKYDPEQ